jgi:hypothetical protein
MKEYNKCELSKREKKFIFSWIEIKKKVLLNFHTKINSIYLNKV